MSKAVFSHEEAAWEGRFQSLVANIPGAVYRCAFDDEWTGESSGRRT